MNDKAPLTGELALRDALSRVADQYGKIAAKRIFDDWLRTKLDEPGRVKS